MPNSNVASLKDRPIWYVFGLAGALIAIFLLYGTKLSLPVAAVFILLVASIVSHRPERIFIILLLAACYERPVLDLGIGIRGTLKLVDLVIIALCLSQLLPGKRQAPIFPQGNEFRFLIPIIALAAFSVAAVWTLGTYKLDAKTLNLYYFVVLVEYGVAYYLLRRIRISQEQIISAFKAFFLGLTVVGSVAILQGLDIIDNAYYTSVSGIETRIAKDWVISTLGPNHSHLGSYMAMGFVLSLLLCQVRSDIKYLIPIPIFLMAIAYAHSTVGFAMLGVFLAFIYFSVTGKYRTAIIFLSVIFLIFSFLYLTGIIGIESGRTIEKLQIDDDSELITRAFIQPIRMLVYGYQQFPIAVLAGFGFKIPNYTVPGLVPTGDNNYFSLLLDLGLVGLTIYVLFLLELFKGLKRASRFAISRSEKIVSANILAWYKTILVAMLFQEILWPIHSRGSTMLIMLTVFHLGGMYVFTNRRGLSRDERHDRSKRS